MRDILADRWHDRPAKNYREQQNKKNRLNRAGIRQQRMSRDRAYLAIAIMNLAVGVMMERDNNKKSKR